jgi:hypothetical protein
LNIVAGDNQLGYVGQQIPNNVQVRVTNPSGANVPNVWVRFVVSGGDGTLLVDKVRTNANGLATLAAANWVLGARGKNTLTAIAGSQSVTFKAQAVSIVAQSAVSQTAARNAVVSEDPMVSVSDSDGSPLQGINVVFAVTAGGGGVVNLGAVATNNTGQATCGNWTLGPNVGLNTVRASVGPLSVDFNATAS